MRVKITAKDATVESYEAVTNEFNRERERERENESERLEQNEASNALRKAVQREIVPRKRKSYRTKHTKGIETNLPCSRMTIPWGWTLLLSSELCTCSLLFRLESQFKIAIS